METTMKKSAPLLLWAMLLLAPSAFAAQAAGQFTLSPMIGGIMFEGNQNVDDAFAFGVGIGYNLTKAVATEAAFVWSDGDADLFSYRLDLLYHLRPEARLNPYLAAGIGGYEVQSKTEFMGNYGLGVLYQLTESLALRGDVRHLLIDASDLHHNLLYTAGLQFAFGGAAPMPQPAPAPATVAPAPPAEPPPAQPPVVTQAPMDSDGDGVIDGVDQCPDTPKGVRVDAQGCPRDSDGDGVYDEFDKCPDTPKGVAVDDQGCELKLTLNINFDSNQALIKPEFETELARAAAFLEANSTIPYVLIAGHTDSLGADAYNQQLSERRAEAVRQYLIDRHGIEAGKIQARGYGESQPIADNDTPDGRYRNRRVEVICCTILPE
jgi:OmpA-OmpF porin, OOP family